MDKFKVKLIKEVSQPTNYKAAISKRDRLATTATELPHSGANQFPKADEARHHGVSNFAGDRVDLPGRSRANDRGETLSRS